MEFHERPEFILGRNGEQLVADYLKGLGWYVIPSYDYSGEDNNKAPKLQGIKDGFPVPDLDVAAGGVRRWVEVKTKTSPTWTIKTQRFEHGIEHYDDYLRVSRETGTEAWLAIFETSTGELYMQSFKDLGEPRRTTFAGKRMSFWARDAFILIAKFAADVGVA